MNKEEQSEIPRRPLIPLREHRDKPGYAERLEAYKRLLHEWKALCRFETKVEGCGVKPGQGAITLVEYNDLVRNYNARRNLYVVMNDGLLETREMVSAKIDRIDEKFANVDETAYTDDDLVKRLNLSITLKMIEFSKYEFLIKLDGIDLRDGRLNAVIENVAMAAGVSSSEMIQGAKDRKTVEARQVAIYIAKKHNFASNAVLARTFGISVARVIADGKAVKERLRQDDSELKELVDNLEILL